jgi:hypothetical protein
MSTITRVAADHRHDMRDSMCVSVADLRKALKGIKGSEYVNIDLHSGRCQAFISVENTGREKL